MNNIENQLQELLLANDVHIAQIPSDRKYWFVRTDAGNHFDAFISGAYIGIGWDDVPLTEPTNYTDELIKTLEENGYKQAKRVLNQVNRFYNEMKPGDIVVIPSTSSLSFAFGTISNKPVYEKNDITEDDIENGECIYKRRREVQWIMGGIDRARIDPKLYSFFRNHQAISDVSSHSEYIDRAINTLYIKDNIAHLTFSVDIEGNPKALDIPTFIFGLLSRSEDIAKELHCIEKEADINSEISTRINVQSPGVIEIIGGPCLVCLAAVVTIALFGGKFKFEVTKEKTSAECSTGGLIEAILKFLERYKDKDFIGEKEMNRAKNNLNIKNISED